MLLDLKIVKNRDFLSCNIRCSFNAFLDSTSQYGCVPYLFKSNPHKSDVDKFCSPL